MTNEPNPWGIPGYGADTYGESFADVYDDWYSDLPDQDFSVCVARSLPDRAARVLELGVGTGRLVARLRSLRAHSDTIVGIDSSTSMLDVARTRDLGADTELVRGDFSRELPTGPFDCVFVGYNTFFNLPDHAAMSACMRLVADRLAHGASFLLDVVNPAGIPAGTTTTEVPRPTGDPVRAITFHDPETQRITGRFVESTDGTPTRVREWSVRYASPEQLDAIAHGAGLTLVSRSADGNGTVFTHDSPRHVSVWRGTAVSF